MATTKCGTCGGEVEAKVKVCPSCGAQRKRGMGCVAWLGFGFFLLVISSCIETLGEFGIEAEKQRRAEEQGQAGQSADQGAGRRIRGEPISRFAGRAWTTLDQGGSVLGQVRS